MYKTRSLIEKRTGFYLSRTKKNVSLATKKMTPPQLAYSIIIQGIVDGSASKPALIQYTGYMVEKTYHDIAPYFGGFGPI